jgi:hypothetical protein
LGRAILGITISHVASGPDARGPEDFRVSAGFCAGMRTGTALAAGVGLTDVGGLGSGVAWFELT